MLAVSCQKPTLDTIIPYITVDSRAAPCGAKTDDREGRGLGRSQVRCVPSILRKRVVWRTLRRQDGYNVRSSSHVSLRSGRPRRATTVQPQRRASVAILTASAAKTVPIIQR
jgi:hypothetical protein